MAVFRTLKSLIRNPNPRSRLYFCGSDSPLRIHAPPSSPSAAAASIAGLHLTSSLSGLRRSGPLFLSSPAWKLLQSATPLYFRGRPPAFPSDRLRVRRFPIKLGFGAAADIGRGAPDVVRWTTQAPISGGPQFQAPVADRFLNLPNLVSISRMVSGPFIGWMIINEWYLPAFCGLVISGATDWLDGFLARKMNINSVFGSYLDPLADKVLIGCVALAMVEKDLLHPGLVGLVVLRDVALVGGAIYKRASSLGWKWKSWSDFMNLDATHRERMEPLFISKINTVLQLLLVAAALLQSEFGIEDSQLYITYLSWLVASTTVASAAGYGIQHFRYR